ncbi:glycosyltransferase family 4 protein [Pseudomonas benzenivorans]|uniref:Glycosyltransferase family 4 protein n=1 Tax=Pseudomonas benzenivorans TaxID=556533 RepID=A0ABY5H418_9PSED|nr:glycosyltransferase family 4 protein [Pseudomonas benzenivorans]UTW06970.1 glycosyltransferase family 4 protein [Pseudomonas benzenivorans]
MRFLFVHQRFPGQFKHIACALADDPRHEVVAVGDVANIKASLTLHPRVTVYGYASPKAGEQQTHVYLREYENHVRRGQQLLRACLRLKEQGFVPDVVAVHPGWGEGLFLGEIFPTARHIHYCEYYYHAEGADLGFDPEFPAGIDSRLHVRLRNATQLLGLSECAAGVSPTRWQRSLYPAEFQSKIRVLHEGIDTSQAKPDPRAFLEVQGKVFRAGDQVITYVARNLEPYRGFHRFVRALPELQARCPTAQFVVVGGDEVSYGARLPAGQSYRETYVAELGERVDWSRVHFLGRLPYRQYLKVLQLSSAHIYLTYPFVLSWSMLEAMACGCLVIGSATPPVQEVITHGENGLLVDFFDTRQLADQVAEVLADPLAFSRLRSRAREYIEQHYDLRTHGIPAWIELLTQHQRQDQGMPRVAVNTGAG